jgi:hypothetical protein
VTGDELEKAIVSKTMGGGVIEIFTKPLEEKQARPMAWHSAARHGIASHRIASHGIASHA